MFPGGRSSQNVPDGNSAYPRDISYYRDVAAVSNPTWFGNNPTPVPPPVQYPSRAESGRDLLAESYERMRNEMRSLQGSSTSKYGGGAAAPPPPVIEEKANPLTQLLENKDVSLSSLLEAAMDPSIGSSKRTEDPIMKKAILDRCEGKIAQLYRLRISGQGMFFPMTQPKNVKFDGVSTLTYNHPRIEFNMVPEDPVWTCPDVVIKTENELEVDKKVESENKGTKNPEEQKDNEKDQNPTNTKDKIEVLEPRGREPPHIAKQQEQRLLQQQQQQQQHQLLIQQPPPVANVSYPALSQYRPTIPPLMDEVMGHYSRPPPIIPNTGQLTVEVLAELEKERRRKEIESEWDRLMQDKERKEKKRKRRKRSRSKSRGSSRSRSGSRKSRSRRSRSRYRSHSRGRSSHRRSHSRHRSRGRSRDRRYRRRSRSFSFSPSPPNKRTKSPFRLRYRRSPSPRVPRRSSPFLAALHRELTHTPPRYRHSPPPRPREELPPHGPASIHPYSDTYIPSLPEPPGYDNYYDYGAGQYPPNHPPQGIDSYGNPYGPGMQSYGPMGPGPRGPGPGPCGPGPGPWMDPHYGPPIRGPGPWMGPGPGPQWFGPRPPLGPMGPREPMPPHMHRPPIGPPRPIPPVAPLKAPSNNLIDLTSSKAKAVPAEKKPIAVVDITDDNDNSTVASTKVGPKRKPESETSRLAASDKLSEAVKLKPAERKAEKSKVAEKETEKLVVNKAKVITNLVPPGVSPDRETHAKYPNVESEFTRPMRAKFRKMLEPLDKILDKIRLYQRDSFDFKTLIKSLESGKIEFMGVHTLHDGLLCKLEINRKQPDKFFKIVVPFTHAGRVLRAIHSTYHDYSIGKIQRLIDDLFCDPHDFPLSKIISVVKQCKECIEAEEKERENWRKKEILILDSPEPAETDVDEPDENNVAGDPMVKPHTDRQHQRSPECEERKRERKDERSRHPSQTEREGKSRRDSGKDRTEKSRGDTGDSKTKSQRKSPTDEGAETYSKFEDLGVSRKAGGTTKSVDGENGNPNNKVVGGKGKNGARKGVQSEVQRSSKDGKIEEKDGEGSTNGKKVPSVSDSKLGSKNDEVQVFAGEGKAVSDDKKGETSANQKKPISLDKSTAKTTVAMKESGDVNQAKSTGKVEEKPQPKPQQKPTVNPDDFKERVRTVQMGVDPLGAHISNLEEVGKKSSDPSLLLKAGMLCRRLPPPKGQGKAEVKIVVTPACLMQMVEIVHTMTALHAPFQKTVTVFNKHFVPIDGLEKAVSGVLYSCAKCSSEVKN